jgi:CDP-diglyceride synthetase
MIAGKLIMPPFYFHMLLLGVCLLLFLLLLFLSRKSKKELDHKISHLTDEEIKFMDDYYTEMSKNSK